MTSAQRLVSELRSKGHLPALDGSVGAICTLTADPLTCVADLTAVILRDCSLTSNLIATANSALYGTSEPIKTVSAAISLLGFDLIRSLSMGLGIVKQVSECAENRNLYRLFAAAYFSGMLAMALGQRSSHEAPEELFVTGILSALPRLLLAHAYPEKYAAMERKVMSGQEDLGNACLSSFGATYQELAAEIARFWNLPAAVLRTLRADDRTDKGLALVREASRISDMMFGNARGGAAALSAVESKLRGLMQDKTLQLAEFIPDTCVADPNTSRFFKLTRQDVEMMVRIVEWGKVNPAEVANLLTFGAANHELQDTAKEDPALVVGQFLTELTMAARSGANINEILLATMEGIYRCLRPACVIVAFPNAASGRLEGRFCLGNLGGIPVTEFQAALDMPASAVAQSMNTKRAISASVARDLPLPYLKHLNLDYLLLVPIVAFSKSIGLYLIGRETSMAFTKQEESWCAAMIEHVAIAFERIKASKSPPTGP